MFMTFSIKTSMKNSNINQAGVSLMLAVLVLAAITAVAFSLATIVFIEIRSSGDSARTEPALYATLGVTEEALFQYKRFYEPSTILGRAQFDVPTCSGPKGSDVCSINGVTLSLPRNQPLAFDNSPRIEYVPAGSTITLPLYVANSYEQQFASACVEVIPNDTLSGVAITYRVNDELGGTSDVYTANILPGEVCGSYTGFGPTGQYELIIENTNTQRDVSVKISTERVNAAQPDGLPFVGEQVLRIMANYAGLTRTYQVRIPIP